MMNRAFFLVAEEIEARNRIADVALTWLNTRFLDNQCAKGLGVDCANLPKGVLKEALNIDVVLPEYSPQVYLHNPGDTTYLDTIGRYCRAISESEAKRGDFVLYKLRDSRSFSHGGIIIDWPDRIIHPVRRVGVILSHGLNEGFLKRREKKFFTVF